ncbi:MAG: hypothetical protein K9H64_20820 [Bacteroidales bacterium]|nr:hypothetical protein [Bacteroidales bacterium]MCF8458487.1 hypothetical protein [Bacteroidales bacterium]
MAEVKKNIITKGLSGMLGQTLVFRNMGDRTIVASRPSSNKIPSEAQLEQRKRFQEAVLYAKSQMADETSKAEYAAVAQKTSLGSAYTIAVADFFNAPDISNVDLAGYAGAIGDKIKISVTDVLKVTKVEIDIFNPDGSLVESGEADFLQGAQWEYTSTVANIDLSGDKIVVRAYDKPGNMTENESVI